MVLYIKATFAVSRKYKSNEIVNEQGPDDVERETTIYNTMYTRIVNSSLL